MGIMMLNLDKLHSRVIFHIGLGTGTAPVPRMHVAYYNRRISIEHPKEPVDSLLKRPVTVDITQVTYV